MHRREKSYEMQTCVLGKGDRMGSDGKVAWKECVVGCASFRTCRGVLERCGCIVVDIRHVIQVCGSVVVPSG